MILKGSQRGGGQLLARHLLNADTNDHIELHEIRHLAGANLHAALQEIELVAKGTRCKQPFFHVSFNPPQDVSLRDGHFEKAFAAVEKKMGLENQPRAVIFHEKNGRRHAHVVWSRIDVENMHAVPLSHSHLKLGDVSLSLFREFGLEPPKGLLSREQRNPDNFERKTWQQARRIGEDPRDLKQVVRQSFEKAKDMASFRQNLQSHGLFLAKGDRRGFVVVHHSGEPMSLTKYAGVKAREVKSRIGNPEQLPAIAMVQEHIRQNAAQTIRQRLRALKVRQQEERLPLVRENLAMRQLHQASRREVKRGHSRRWAREQLARANQLRKGITGLWDRVSGRRGRVSRRNKREIIENRRRDREEKRQLIDQQLKERQELQSRINRLRAAQLAERKKLTKELGKSIPLKDSELQRSFTEAASLKGKQLEKGRSKEDLKEKSEAAEREEETKKKSGGRKRGVSRTRKPGPGV